MVEVRTIISDLYRNRSRGMVGRFDNGNNMPDQDVVLSPFYRVKQAASPVMITAGNAPDFKFVRAPAPRNASNAYHLYFQEKWSTLSTLTRHHRIVEGGYYSGCLYSVYAVGDGNYKCIHTDRPNGDDKEDYVEALRDYARDQRWTLVHEVPTRNEHGSGVGIAGCVTTFVVTRVSYTINPRPIVRTVRLRQDVQGNSVGWDRWEDPG